MSKIITLVNNSNYWCWTAINSSCRTVFFSTITTKNKVKNIFWTNQKL